MKEKMNFEEALRRLEESVKRLESGALSLEESIDEYKKGLELSSICSGKLKDAQELLVKINEDGFEEIFDIGEK